MEACRAVSIVRCPRSEFTQRALCDSVGFRVMCGVSNLAALPRTSAELVQAVNMLPRNALENTLTFLFMSHDMSDDDKGRMVLLRRSIPSNPRLQSLTECDRLTIDWKNFSDPKRFEQVVKTAT